MDLKWVVPRSREEYLETQLMRRRQDWQEGMAIAYVFVLVLALVSSLVVMMSTVVLDSLLLCAGIAGGSVSLLVVAAYDGMRQRLKSYHDNFGRF